MVEVELGHGYVVLEPSMHRHPHGVNQPQRRVAVSDLGHDNADTDEVVDLFEGLSRLDHFPVDRVVMFGAAGDPGLNACLGEDPGHLLGDLLDEYVSFGSPLSEFFLYFPGAAPSAGRETTVSLP